MATNNQKQRPGTNALGPFSQEMPFLLIQLLREHGFSESAHSLERDTGVYFDLHYFEGRVQAGAWAEVEWYLKGYFPQILRTSHAFVLFFEIYKWKYLDALQRGKYSEALNILNNDIKPLVSSRDDRAFQELVLLLSQDSARWGTLPIARDSMRLKIRNLVLGTPELQNKLNFPNIAPSRLTTLLMQSMSWQHHLCQWKQPNPVVATLFQDHNCEQYDESRAQNIRMSPAGPSSRPQGVTVRSSDEAALH